ncbi:MAG: aggregation-promoting factor C-terminal-like domain-containing protein [Streptosporangiaceae bacterium]
MEVEHASGMPGRKFALTPLRLRLRASTSRFTTSLSVTALALAGLLAGTGSSAARPAVTAAARPNSAVSARLLSADVLAAQQRIDHRDHDHDTDLRRDRLSPNREIAWRMIPRFGWKSRYQFHYVNWLWNRESSWNVHAMNPYSGAYGIPQAMPGAKMRSAGRNWQSSATVQIRWGLRYIRAVYGSPRRAWAHECAYGWY